MTDFRTIINTPGMVAWQAPSGRPLLPKETSSRMRAFLRYAHSAAKNGTQSEATAPQVRIYPIAEGNRNEKARVQALGSAHAEHLSGPEAAQREAGYTAEPNLT